MRVARVTGLGLMRLPLRRSNRISRRSATPAGDVPPQVVTAVDVRIRIVAVLEANGIADVRVPALVAVDRQTRVRAVGDMWIWKRACYPSGVWPPVRKDHMFDG